MVCCSWCRTVFASAHVNPNVSGWTVARSNAATVWLARTRYAKERSGHDFRTIFCDEVDGQR